MNYNIINVLNKTSINASLGRKLHRAFFIVDAL